MIIRENDVRVYYGNPVLVLEYNGCLVRVKTLDGQTFLVRPGLLEAVTAEQFCSMDFWDASQTQMGMTESEE